MEAASNRLQKEAKGYLDSLRGGLNADACPAFHALERSDGLTDAAAQQ